MIIGKDFITLNTFSLLTLCFVDNSGLYLRLQSIPVKRR